MGGSRGHGAEPRVLHTKSRDLASSASEALLKITIL